MQFRFLLVAGIAVFYSCKKEQETTKDLNSSDIISLIREDDKSIEPPVHKKSPVDTIITCETYWEGRFPDDRVRSRYINKVILENRETLPPANLEFLEALRLDTPNVLSVDRPLFPIFRLSGSEIGIFAFPRYKMDDHRLVPVSPEMELISEYGGNVNQELTQLHFYPQVLDSLYKSKDKPRIHYYSLRGTGMTQVRDLGIYTGECLEYFQYSIDTVNITRSDSILFGSPFEIELEYGNVPAIDTIILKDFKSECYDCPSSMGLQKTVARVKGTNDLFFIYADTFPLNNRLDTPSRALILIEEETEIIYLWFEELDLFGCSCF